MDGHGRWLGTVPVQAGSNAIPAARQLLAKLPLENKTALADALHTQTETAQQILFERGGDYALTVKDNQKELVQTLATLLTPGKFSPSAHAADPRADRERNRRRREIRVLECLEVTPEQVGFPGARLIARLRRRVRRNGKLSTETEHQRFAKNSFGESVDWR